MNVRKAVPLIVPVVAFVVVAAYLGMGHVNRLARSWGTPSFFLIGWVVLAIAFVAGVSWLARDRQSKKAAAAIGLILMAVTAYVAADMLGVPLDEWGLMKFGQPMDILVFVITIPSLLGIATGIGLLRR